MTSINLLPHETRALEKRAKTATVLKILGTAVFLVSIILSSISIYLNFSVKNQIKSVESESNTIKRTLEATADFEKSLATLVIKAQNLTKIIQNRPLYSKLMTALSQKTPADVSLTSVNVLSETKVSVTGDTLGYLSLAKFLKGLESDPNSIFSQVTLSSVNLNSQTSRVQFIMEISLKDQSLLP